MRHPAVCVFALASLCMALIAESSAAVQRDTDKGWGFFSVGLGLSATYN